MTLEELYRNVLGREARPEEIENWNFGNSVDPEELDKFLGTARKEATTTMPTTGAVGHIAQQILDQNTTDKWGGEGFGSAQKNAYDMAAMLAGQGITDINQFGAREKFIPGGEIYSGYDQTPSGDVIADKTVQEYYNKETGEPIQSYYDKARDGVWGGTFEGKGSTAYGVQFDEKGNPVFYSKYGGSSNDVANLLDDPLLRAAAQIGAAYFGGQAGSAALAAAMGGDLGDISKAYVLSNIGSGVAEGVSGAEGVVNAIGQTGANIAGQVAGAVATGGDPVTALVTGGIGAAVPEITSQIPGFSDFNSTTKNAINKVVASTLASGGDVSPSQLVSAAFAAAKSYVPSDLSEKPVDKNYRLTTDFGIGADYGLGPKSDGQGFQLTEPSEGFNKDGSVNYDLLDYSKLSQLGMDMPKTGNLESMGGGQGLRIPVEGGFITESGFTPEGYTPNLGDSKSFINQPAPKVVKTNAPAVNGPKAYDKQNIDVNALMSLLGEYQAAPTIVSSGQDNSADIELMQDIFGTSLSAPSAGNTDTRESKLARLLRT